MTSPIQATNNAADSQFEIHEGGKVATLAYSERDGKLYLIHTEVPRELGGRGLASALARAALDHARQSRLTVVPYCPFVRAYLKRHPEYSALVEH